MLYQPCKTFVHLWNTNEDILIKFERWITATKDVYVDRNLMAQKVNEENV